MDKNLLAAVPVFVSGLKILFDWEMDFTQFRTTYFFFSLNFWIAVEE